MQAETQEAVSLEKPDPKLEQMAQEIAHLRQQLTIARNLLVKLAGSITQNLGE